MAVIPIAANSTLEEAVQTLTKPEDYICGALLHMHKCKKELGAAVLRIGTTGEGKAPHYRVEFPSQRDEIFGPGQCTSFHIFGAFQGKNHKPLPLVPEGEEADILKKYHWSERVIDLEAVQQVLGTLRANKRSARSKI